MGEPLYTWDDMQSWAHFWMAIAFISGTTIGGLVVAVIFNIS